MRRIIVDSGSSIKVGEKERYVVDILPIQLQMGEEFFLDGVNLSTEEFYRRLKDSKQFPKTSLPSLDETQKLVDSYTAQGDEVLIITISSEISGTYQAGLMVNPLYVVNFFLSGIPMGFVITWVYLESDRSILACMIFHFFVNFMQEKIAMTPETKCLETIVITLVTVIIVMAKKDMFFETRHVGRLLEYSNNQQ